MKIPVTIEKSIGFTYLVKHNGEFYDIITYDRANKLIGNDVNINKPFLQHTEYPERINGTINSLGKLIHWIDKKRTINSILKKGVTGSKILIEKSKYSKRIFGYVELDKPNIFYILKVDGFELYVNKTIFLRYAKNPEIKERRSL